MQWGLDALAKVDFSDTDAWPALQTRGTWSLGLKRPQLYIVSLAMATARRKRLAEQLRKLDFSVEFAQWTLGIVGTDVPVELRNPRGELAMGSERRFRRQPGYFGSFLAHLMAFNSSLQRCHECDLVVLEDDVIFHPDFKSLWLEFVQKLPDEVPVDVNPNSTRKRWARLHLGGNFWMPPVRETPGYWQVLPA